MQAHGGVSNHGPPPITNNSIGRTIQNPIELDREIVDLTIESEYMAPDLLLNIGNQKSKLEGKLIGHGNPAKGAPSSGRVYLYVWAQGSSGFGHQCRILNVGETGGMVAIKPEQIEHLSEVRAMMAKGTVVSDKGTYLRWRFS